MVLINLFGKAHFSVMFWTTHSKLCGCEFHTKKSGRIVAFWAVLSCNTSRHFLDQSQQVNNRNTRTICKISSKLTIKTPEQRQWGRSSIFTVNFEQISQIAQAFLLLRFNQKISAGTYRFSKYVRCATYLSTDFF